MSKFTGWLYKIISGIYGLLLLVILGVCLFAYQTDYSYRKLGNKYSLFYPKAVADKV